ncbi:MAG: CPBP family intramembrane metalloprotease [Chitinophagaceae bacterium]|nr:CPBP family intramembrane metalloprotease [Chitinophagaceae bacterium]
MAHYATKRFNYWGQLGILFALFGAGMMIGGIIYRVPLLLSPELTNSKEPVLKQLEQILRPDNATLFRITQSAAAIFLFLIPAVLYARICHVKAMQHFGFHNLVNSKQVILVMVIMTACLPLVSMLQDITTMLPWSKAALQEFKAAEDSFNKQVVVIARMNGIGDYFITVFVIALLPAITEELLFRGALQNLLSRWLKKPVLAIIITSVLFSAMHGSYLGFLSRFVLGFMLGWMYYRTGNIWLNIIAHFFNNAAAATSLYLSTKVGSQVDTSKLDEHFPWWASLLSLALVMGLFIVFDKVSNKQIDHPGEELLIPGYNFSNNPFINDIASQQEGSQQ